MNQITSIKQVWRDLVNAMASAKRDVEKSVAGSREYWQNVEAFRMAEHNLTSFDEAVKECDKRRASM